MIRMYKTCKNKLIIAEYRWSHSHSSNFWIFNQGNHWKIKYLDYMCFDVFSERTPSVWRHIKISPVEVFAFQKYASLNMGMNLAMAEVRTHIGPNDVIISTHNI